MLKLYSDLTKFGIVVFVVLSALAGYAMGFEVENTFDWQHLLNGLLGVYFLSSGSLALNQTQEYKLDRRMKRTEKRPIASGKLKPLAGLILALGLIAVGLERLFSLSLTAGYLGVLTLALYNGIYTYYWKRKWVFAAVPGAIPGALPVTIGYALTNQNILSTESIYLFLIMFLWQMPHFWCLAIKFKDDYQDGGIPTLPVSLGMDRTLLHTGMYTFVYVGTALAAPWFLRTSWFYILLVVPFSLWTLREFLVFYKFKGEKNWLPFFMVTNVSLLIFLFVPIIDKWNFLFMDHT